MLVSTTDSSNPLAVAAAANALAVPSAPLAAFSRPFPAASSSTLSRASNIVLRI